MEKTQPAITEYGYHHHAMFYSEDEKELEAVGKSIKATVPATHKEYKPLQEAYRVRRDELRLKAAEEAAKKAQEETEKAGK
jgi:hypothetical protein